MVENKRFRAYCTIFDPVTRTHKVSDRCLGAAVVTLVKHQQLGIQSPSVQNSDSIRGGRTNTMLVGGFMPTARQRLTTIKTDETLADAARLLSETHVGLVVVCASDGSIAGVVAKTDVVRQVAQGHESIRAAYASTIMTKNVVHCRPSDLLYEVRTRFRAYPDCRQALQTIRRRQRAGCTSSPSGRGEGRGIAPPRLRDGNRVSIIGSAWHRAARRLLVPASHGDARAARLARPKPL
jgi:hypothetical protein